MDLSPSYNAGNIAVVLFARTALEEARNKPFFSSKRQNSIFWKRMEDRTTKAIQKTGLDFHRYTQENCQGNNFGERVAFVFSDLFAKGYQKVIMVGNDCPDLSDIEILEASDRLDSNQIVLGADRRGGAYLIGLQRHAFCATKIKKLAWNSASLIHSINNFALTSNFSLEFIAEKVDVNYKHEFHSLKKTHKILKIIFREFCENFFSDTYHYFKPKRLILYSYSRRGPPLSI